MATRPRRSILKRNYRELADIRVPKRSQVLHPSSSSKSRTIIDIDSSEKLYRLRIVDRDDENNRVNVTYIGYGTECDEWRLVDDIIELSDSSSSDEAACASAPIVEVSERREESRFCLYKELRDRIKSMLYVRRKGDPVCIIVMPFDKVFFEGLIRRGEKTNGQRNREMYQLCSLTKLDDILGGRWYIRGLNMAGDFCYVKPRTVKYYLKRGRQKVDYQIQSDGSVIKYSFGGSYQLVFHFVRGDGTATEWDHVLQSCQ